MEQPLIAQSILSKAEIKRLRDQLNTYKAENNAVIFLSNMTQVYCQRIID